MLVRNLDFLSIPKEFSKVELDIYQGQSIALVYIENKGYSLVLKENDAINSVFLLKTELTPDNINSDKEDFINVIKMLLDRIYSAADIKEYEKMHQEHVFLQLMDMLTEGDKVELITEESKIYTDIEKGFMKLEIDIMDNKINSLNSAIGEISGNLNNLGSEFEENKIENRLRKTFQQ
ncbi:hypothetical protein [Methanobrevibacter ruminantium]|uniref:hypothetical protein n=1 Tax=Methanobrevibacter ruminantium TaxID=83816 RepID=UPI003F018AAB